MVISAGRAQVAAPSSGEGEADLAYTLAGELAQEVRRDPQLALRVTYPPTPFWLDFTGKWDPKSPWHDQRVRLAASGASGSASTRLENYVVSWGEFAYGGYPDLDALYPWSGPYQDVQLKR